jgi:uncharacterized protein
MDSQDSMESTETYQRKLEDFFLKYKGALIAFSGGVDSTLLAYVAHKTLGNRMMAILADSPSLSRREFHFAINFAKDHGIPLKVIHTEEMKNPLYRANQANRCYYCKKALFEKMEEIRGQLKGVLNESSLPIFYGANLNDLEDFRPGMKAANEASILAPYIELGIDKKTIRSIAAFYGLKIAKKPALPCMSSRIIYGEEVTSEKLNQIEKAENVLYDLNLAVVRVRYHGYTARIEVPPQDFKTILKNREMISRKFHELGFKYVSLDIDGFKSGSLNAILKSR